jgi:hypothetical protein
MKTLKILFVFVSFCLLSFLLQNCNSPKTSRFLIEAPMEGIALQFGSHDIDASAGGVIGLENGSSIQIPAGSFVDGNNQPVKGNVKIEYREFHDATDILTSGIPMLYDSAGVKINFQTAGMFEINGAVNGEPIYVAKDKNITVNMTSSVAGDDYNFYKLDPENGNWEFKGIATPKTIQKENDANSAKDNAKMAETDEKPVLPKKVTDKSLILDFDVNYSAFPELKPFHGIMWEYAGSDNAQNPDKNKWILTTKWTKVELLPNDKTKGLYSLQLSNGEKTFNTTVTPALSGRKYETALKDFEKKMAQYNQNVENIKKEAERVSAQNKLLRTYAINGFGIYNWDRALKLSNAVALNANFTFEPKMDLDINKISVFLVVDGKDVIKYPREDWNKFAFSPDYNNQLVAVLPDNKMAIYSVDDFRLNQESIKTQSSYTFTLKVKSAPIKTREEFKQNMAAL